ncbi:hypothetical protein QH494_15970 [Sphingomonas sp. AR_OL41]|uniref:Bbp16 family capsid cement protein n=1 Tax=Sphingomonas sp. AR_OL41 TaxID=3042729 RepID=UPI0024817E9C|nr:hypothetical protein [Sphingomonas sp. AR_OL41]MDH7973689.1 hypothetical protein [Sphingomonas sp. AR_OL41]
MILDNFLVFSGAISAAGVMSGQAVNTAGSFLSTNTVDLAPLALGGNQVFDVGQGEPLEIAISILTAPTVGTSVQYQLIQADDAALSSNVQVINQTDALPIASLTVGQIVALHYDRAAPYLPKRYIGLRYVNVGAIATASYFAAIVKNIADVKNLYGKSGFSVL